MKTEEMTTCPRCRSKFYKERRDALEQFDAAYGKLDKWDFIRLWKNLPSHEVYDRHTLKQSIYMQTGCFDNDIVIYYHCQCPDCGFEHKASFVVVFPPLEEEREST